MSKTKLLIVTSPRAKLAFALAAFAAAASGCDQIAGGFAPFPKVMSFEEFTESESLVKAMAKPNCDEKCVKRRQEFRYVVYVGKQIYCYWDLKRADTGTDFDKLAKDLEQSITTLTTYQSYYKTLRRWASAFHDGHVNVMATADLTALEIYTSPVRLEVLAPATDHEQVVVVTGAEGLVAGDKITHVNGVPINEALTRASDDASSGSTKAMRRFWAARRLVDVTGADQGSQPLVLTAQDASGKTKVAQIPRTVQLDLNPIPGAPAPAADTGASLFSAKILPGGWGYFRLDGFSGTQDEALISRAMDRLAGTPGLILDLRKNGGGDLSGDRIIERLITKPVIRYKRSERLSDILLSQRPGDMFDLTPDSTGAFSLWHDLVVKPLADKYYNRRVVALISPYCFSACDTFTSSLKANGLAILVGEPTGGGTGTPLVFSLPVSPLQFRYSVIRGQDPKGNLIEGRATTPDVAIEPTREDRATGKDTQLLKAIEVLQGHPLRRELTTQELGVEAIWTQPSDIAPTVEEMELIRRLSAADSIGG